MKILFTLFIFVLYAFGNELPKSMFVPGGIIELYVKSSIKPKAFHNNKELMVLETDSKNIYRVIAGINLNFDTSKKYEIDISYGVKEVSKKIKIKEYNYKKQYIKLKTSKHVDLSKKNLNRYKKDREESLHALDLFTTKKFDKLKMIMPLNRKFEDDFGKRRYFNNKPRKPHSGVDLAADIGTPIKAPLSGEVVISDNFFFNGNTIYIDHGLGLVTLYCHMSELNVKKGDFVKQGDVIGKVGKTGRVTGPHLHWGISLGGEMINPKLFF